MISVASDSVLVSDATFIMITIVAGKRDMKGLGMSHPYVSEDHDGNPWFEWIVAVVVIIATALAVAGYTKAATAAIAVTAIVTGLVRLVLRERSPWKVRSVVFDAFMGVGLGAGLLILLTIVPVGN